MGLTGHRRTSSHKRRRASHFALVKPPLATDKAGATHLMHHVAPGATEYRGIAIHRKGAERKLEKMLAKTKATKAKAKGAAAHDHDHDHGPDHSHSKAGNTKN